MGRIGNMNFCVFSVFMQTHRKQGKCISIEEPHNHYMCHTQKTKKQETKEPQKCHKNIKLDTVVFFSYLDNQRQLKISPTHIHASSSHCKMGFGDKPADDV